MSYSVYPYVVDLSELYAAFGSRDAELATTLVEVWDEEVRDNAWDFSRAIEVGAPTLAQALQDLVDGSVTQPDAAWQYGYALELLCRHFGQRLPNPAFEELRPYAIGYFDAIDGLRPLNLGSRMPLPIPTPEDFPAVSYLTADEVIVALTTEQSFSDGIEDAAWKAEAGGEYRRWLEAAAAARKALVFFLY